MQNLVIFIKWVLATLRVHARILPESFVVIYTLVVAGIEGFQNGWRAGLQVVVEQIFMAEYIIRHNVDLAINNDPTYTFLAFMAIVNGVLVMYVLTNLIYKGILVGLTGSTAPVSGILISLLIVGIIEMAAIGWRERIFFVPIWDGLIYLLLNLKPVLWNINWLSWATPELPVLDDDFTVNATSLPSIEQTPVAPDAN